MSGLTGSEGTRLEQELINTDEAKDVTSWYIFDWLDEATHHENCALNGLNEKVFLLTRGVVRALNANLQAGADSTSKDTTEGIKSTLIRSWHHLGDVKHERGFRVTVADTDTSFVIRGTLVQMSLHGISEQSRERASG